MKRLEFKGQGKLKENVEFSESLTPEFDGTNILKRDNMEQITIYEYANMELPPIDRNIQYSEKKNRSKRRDKAVESSISGNATFDAVNAKSSISIDTIKTVRDIKSTDKGPAVLETVPYTGTNKMIKAMSDRDKARQAAEIAAMRDAKKHPYTKKQQILTEAEKRLYVFMQVRLEILRKKISKAVGKDIGSIVIMPKVRLADVIQVNPYGPKNNKALYKIAYKHLDFLIMTPAPKLELLCAVELDDYTHNTKDRVLRDNFVDSVLQDCDIKLFRVKVRIGDIKPEHLRGMEACIIEHFAPKCPDCGRPMIMKSSSRKRNYGHRFYGCIGWWETGEKHCGKTIDID